IEQHLKSQHPRVSAVHRAVIVTKAESLSDLAQVESDVIYPAPADPPVTQLPVYHDGLMCTGRDEHGKECSYICRTPRGIRKHCSKEHGWVNDQKRGG
ncbi:hypothetical protein GE09DRAFT_933458, partial [Coniochaeta sp. 2T2.1]